jgi:hypothetical protein
MVVGASPKTRPRNWRKTRLGGYGFREVGGLEANMHAAALALLLSVALEAPSRSGTASAVPFVVAVAPDASCPEAAQFPARLMARSGRVRVAAPGERAMVYSLFVHAVPGGYRGRLVTRDGEGRTTEREVIGDSCTGVVDALALVAAVLVDQEPLPARTPEPSRGSGESRWGVGFGTTVELNTAAGPHLGPGARIELLASWRRPSAWAPELRLGLAQRLRSTASSAAGDASFGGWAVRASLSPFEWPAGRAFSFRPAAGFEIGRLEANGKNTHGPDSAAIPWVAPELSAFLRLRIVGPLAAAAETSLVVPLYRDSFYFDTPSGPDTVFTVPSVGLGAGVGLFVELP